MSTAQPVDAPKKGFDIASAKPVEAAAAPKAKEEKASWIDYTPAPLLEGALAFGSGAVATPIAGLAGIATGGNADVVRSIQDAGTYEPRTAGGKKALSVVSYPFEKMAELGDWAGKKAVDATSILPDEMRAAIGAGVNAGVQFLPALVGKGAGAVAKAMPARRMSPAVEAARDYKITPDEAGAGPISRTGAGLSGEAKLAKKISNDNQSVHAEKIAKDLELPKDTVLDREATEAVREQQGQAYEVVRKTGKVTADDTFKADLEAAASDVRTAAEDFGHRKESPILKVVDSMLEKETFDANSAVSEIKNLRKDAKKAFRAGDEELGIGSLDVARALEDVLDRHVQKLSTSNEYGGLQIGPEAMDALKKARVMIAKSYAADKALRGTDINPQVYAEMLKNKVPLTGGAKEVAEFARDFPRSSMKPSHMAISGPDWSDVIMALASGGKSLLKTAGLSALRPAGRAILSSDVYQAIMRNPDMIRGTLATPEADAAMTGAGIVGAAQPKKSKK